MSDNQEILQALNGIRVELQLLNKTLSSIAGRQGAPARTETQSRPPAGGRRPSARPSAGFKRTDEEPTGYGAEMAARFPKKRGSARPKNKPPAKKGGGYPKKPR